MIANPSLVIMSKFGHKNKRANWFPRRADSERRIGITLIEAELSGSWRRPESRPDPGWWPPLLGPISAHLDGTDGDKRSHQGFARSQLVRPLWLELSQSGRR